MFDANTDADITCEQDFTFVTNFKNGFCGNRCWCSCFRFQFSRTGRQRSKKNSNEELACDKPLKTVCYESVSFKRCGYTDAIVETA